MLRFGPLFLLLIPAAAPAAEQDHAQSREWRIREMPETSDDYARPSIEVGPNARFGLGIFGPKSQTPRRRAVIGSEVMAPKRRRAGVGFSLKF